MSQARLNKRAEELVATLDFVRFAFGLSGVVGLQSGDLRAGARVRVKFIAKPFLGKAACQLQADDPLAKR